jgi:hypothetical protein
LAHRGSFSEQRLFQFVINARRFPNKSPLRQPPTESSGINFSKRARPSRPPIVPLENTPPPFPGILPPPFSTRRFADVGEIVGNNVGSTSKREKFYQVKTESYWNFAAPARAPIFHLAEQNSEQ